MSAQNAPPRCTLASCTILYEMIEEERDRLNKKIFDLKLQMNEMKQTLEKERAAAIEDGLKKAEENDLLNQREIQTNLEKISKQFQDEQSAFKLKVDELEQIIEKEKAEKLSVKRDLEKEKEASKAKLSKNDEELSLLRADKSKLLIVNQQLKVDNKDLQDQINGLEVKAIQASSLNNEQQEKITNLEHELQASKETLNKVARAINTNILDLINGKQQTDQVAPLAPVSSQSFFDNSFDGFSTEDQQSLGAEPLNVSKNSTNDEVDAKQVSEAAITKLPSFSRGHVSANGSSSPQVQPVSEDVESPIVNSPSRVTPVSQMTYKRKTSSPAAIHPIKKTKKNSRRQNNGNDELDLYSVRPFDSLFKIFDAKSSAGVRQNPSISPNLRNRTSSLTYNDDTQSYSDEADNYSDSEETSTGMNRNKLSLRSRSCVAPKSIKHKFAANEYEFQPCKKYDKVVLFAPENKCYHYHYQAANKNYRCSGCHYKKKHNVCGTIEHDENDKEYFWVSKDHVCKPRVYKPDKIIKADAHQF